MNFGARKFHQEIILHHGRNRGVEDIRKIKFVKQNFAFKTARRIPETTRLLVQYNFSFVETFELFRL